MSILRQFDRRGHSQCRQTLALLPLLPFLSFPSQEKRAPQGLHAIASPVIRNGEA